MVGFKCVSKYHHGERWVGDPLYRANIWGMGVCYDCFCCEHFGYKKIRLPKTHVIQATTGVHRTTAWRRRQKAKEIFRVS